MCESGSPSSGPLQRQHLRSLGTLIVGCLRGTVCIQPSARSAPFLTFSEGNVDDVGHDTTSARNEVVMQIANAINCSATLQIKVIPCQPYQGLQGGYTVRLTRSCIRSLYSSQAKSCPDFQDGAMSSVVDITRSWKIGQHLLEVELDV